MKKIRITLNDLFDIPGSEIFNPDEFKPVEFVSIDSRNIKKNSLFVAIKGERLDGHDFVKDAVASGAAAVLIDKQKLNEYDDINSVIITVENTVKALGDIASIWRRKLNAKIIGITGSAGKTSTKELLAALLKEKYRVNKTILNNNNHIGVPLTILSTNHKHDFLVLELGTNHFGEIDYSTNIALPDYALITNIGDSHLEFLKDRRGVLREKEALFKVTAERNGWVFINNDDKLLRKTAAQYDKKVSFAFTSKANVKGKIKKFTDEGKPVIQISYKKKKFKHSFPLYGEQSASNFLAAAAVALKLGMSKKEIIRAIDNFKPVEKRLNVKTFANFVLIDDTYNANPQTMKYAIELLGKIKTHSNKIAVLGDMFELGERGADYHIGLSSAIKKNKIDKVYCIGDLMKSLCDALSKTKIECNHFDTRESLNEFLNNTDLSNTVILVKGSRGMKMEEFVNSIERRAAN
jgi:UDP-N-acetylmuramoyl-tripeptide--D-alanyl-D-alanine ligase